jgi:Zn-dependent M28 family amino/carboxypeptidase
MALNDNRAVEHLDILSNRFGGRLVGSDAYENAALWAAEQFKSWGLDVQLEEVGEMGVGFNRGPWFGRVLGGDLGFTHLYFTTPSYTSGTKGVQRGHVILEPRTMAAFERVKGALKGAWVLLESPSTGWAIDSSAEGDKKREEALKDKESTEPCILYRQMVEAGVLGFIQSTTVPIRTLYDKGVVKNPDITFETLPTVPDIKLDESQFKEIKRAVSERRDVFLEFDIRNHFKPGPVKYHSVVASIKGSKFPDESVILSGHLDAYDVATGGVDCSSGCSAVMEAARMIALSGAKPKRTMYFILFAAEEFGLLGAEAWVKAHPEKLDGISNMFNRDGGPLAYTSFSVPASLVDEFEKISEPLREAYPDYGFTINAMTPRARPTSTGGTDASVFSIRGVPTVGMRETDAKGYDFQYREIWHTERDTFTESIPEYQEQAAAAMAIIGLGTANLDEKFPRNEVYTD